MPLDPFLPDSQVLSDPVLDVNHDGKAFQRLFEAAFPAAEYDGLRAAVGQQRFERGDGEVDAFLFDQSADMPEQRPRVSIVEPELAQDLAYNLAKQAYRL